jgi:hypothetical protein
MASPRLAQQIRIRPAEWPRRETNRGERFPVATPLPEIRHQLEDEIAAAYHQALARSHRR